MPSPLRITLFYSSITQFRLHFFPQRDAKKMLHAALPHAAASTRPRYGKRGAVLSETKDNKKLRQRAVEAFYN